MHVDQKLVLIALLVNIGCCSQADDIIGERHRPTRQVGGGNSQKKIPRRCQGFRINLPECHIYRDTSKRPSINTPSPAPLIWWQAPSRTQQARWPTPSPVQQVRRPPPIPKSRGCGVNSLNQQRTKIVGGNETEVNEYPWATSLIRRNSGVHFCGGALITDRHILTAAHCVEGFDARAIIIRLGEHSLAHDSESVHKDFSLIKINIHENYDTSNHLNDIAVLTMDQPTDFTKSISRICLPTGDELYTGYIATVIGWGTIYFGGEVSQVLQKVAFPVWSNFQCKAAYVVHNSEVFDRNVCAGVREGGKDACQGDSGGPLMVQDGLEGKWYVIGVVSWGIGCARPGLPGVNVRVTKYIDWISSKTI